MSLTLVCPECGSKAAGLGKCWDCGHDARAEPTKPDAPRLSEDDVQRQCKDLLHLHGYEYVDTSQAQRAQITRGLTDLIVLGKGRTAFVEIKRPGQHLTEHQERFRRWCEWGGAEHRVWRSTDDALQWIEGER